MVTDVSKMKVKWLRLISTFFPLSVGFDWTPAGKGTLTFNHCPKLTVHIRASLKSKVHRPQKQKCVKGQILGKVLNTSAAVKVPNRTTAS